MFAPLAPVASDSTVIMPIISSRSCPAALAVPATFCKASMIVALSTAKLSAVILTLSISKSRLLRAYSSDHPNCFIIAISPDVAWFASSSAVFSATRACFISPRLSALSYPACAKRFVMLTASSKVAP